MGRLDIEKQKELEPKRMEYARNQITALGYPVTEVNATTLQFTFRGSPVTLYPYSGWFTGRTVTDGRGIKNLLKQIPMRFALRKQDKIKAVLGNEYLENNILQSLNKYFENSDNDRIYSDIEPDGYVTDYGNKYPLLRINDVANSDAMLEFAVMGQMYDVLNLSYVGRMKG